MKKAIEKEIESLIKQLKPEIKKRFVFRIADYKKVSNKEQMVLADNNTNLEPNLITFYSRAIEKMFKARLVELINHEIIHTFTRNEQDAYKKESKMNFFKEV